MVRQLAVCVKNFTCTRFLIHIFKPIVPKQFHVIAEETGIITDEKT
jgi:hypothetical protein